MRVVAAVLALVACSSNGTVAPPGDPTRFDPVDDYLGVAAFAGEGARLVGFEATGVRADGTVDLTAAQLFTVTYHFERPVAAPADAPPVGAGGSLDGKWHENVDVALWQPGQLRHVSGSGGEYDYRHKGMERRPITRPGESTGPFLDPVHCHLSALWADLGAQGAPPGAVASVSLGPTGWAAAIADTPYRTVRPADDCPPRAEAPR